MSRIHSEPKVCCKCGRVLGQAAYKVVDVRKFVNYFCYPHYEEFNNMVLGVKK